MRIEIIGGIANVVSTAPSDKVIKKVVFGIIEEYSGYTQTQLGGRSRAKHILGFRQVAMYLLRKHTLFTSAKVGKILGKRDHSTVLYSCNVVRDYISTEPPFKIMIEHFNNRLYNLKPTDERTKFQVFKEVIKLIEGDNVQNRWENRYSLAV